jgi:hypothetical protein
VKSIFIEYTYFDLPTAVKAIQIDVYYSESMYSFRIQDAVVHMRFHKQYICIYVDHCFYEKRLTQFDEFVFILEFNSCAKGRECLNAII